MPTARVIGPGRAGTSFAEALPHIGWDVVGLLGPADDPVGAAVGVDLVLITTPDRVVAHVADRIDARGDAVVAHVAGSLGLGVLGGHRRPASIHPLIALPGGAIGAERLLGGGWFAVAGDPLVAELAESLGGRQVVVDDADRVGYHAAAVIASNHLVALMGQVERVAAAAGVPLEAYLDLARTSLDNVAELGPQRALTGPVARGDRGTIDAHLAGLDPSERAAYESMVDQAMRLAGGAGR